MPSIFTRIVQGEIPAVKVYEDEQTLAFMDINPASRGHVLVISKEEYADIFTVPPEILAAVNRTVQRVAVAIRDGLHPDGINILQNNGAASGQEVFHYHVHLIPRWTHDGVLKPWTPKQTNSDELRAVADEIRQAMSK
jgi:histidine triad (HIT) family protein